MNPWDIYESEMEQRAEETHDSAIVRSKLEEHVLKMPKTSSLQSGEMSAISEDPESDEMLSGSFSVNQRSSQEEYGSLSESISQSLGKGKYGMGQRLLALDTKTIDDPSSGPNTIRGSTIRFNRQLAPFGLVLRTITGDGNCLFRALSDQMYDTEAYHMDFRSEVAEFLKNNEQEFSPFVTDACDFNDFAKKMGTPGWYCGEVAITIFARLVKKTIVVYRLGQDVYEMSELLAVIKKSKFPIICICNDRQSQKVRSLANHCFDLRFPKPRVEQIKGRMLSIAAREGFRLESQALNQIIEGANQDIRQTIQHLNLLSVGNKPEGLGFDEAHSAVQSAKKDVAVNVFESGRQLLSGKPIDPKRSLLIEKSDLFFMDYSLMPLFVQENYLNLVPGGGKSESQHMELVSQAAESMAFGDLIENKIRRSMAWNLLPQQAMFSSVIPTLKLNGYLQDMFQFPSWLGKNSTRNKRLRIAQQLQHHMNLKTSSDFNSMVLDYVPYLRDGLTYPITRGNGGADGVPEVVSLIESYDLTSEDRDNIVTELSQWPGKSNILEQIDSKVKAAVTRTLNKDNKMLPYASSDAAKASKKKTGGAAMSEELDEEGNPILGGEGTGDSDVDSDAEDRKIAEASKKKVRSNY